MNSMTKRARRRLVAEVARLEKLRDSTSPGTAIEAQFELQGFLRAWEIAEDRKISDFAA